MNEIREVFFTNSKFNKNTIPISTLRKCSFFDIVNQLNNVKNYDIKDEEKENIIKSLLNIYIQNGSIDLILQEYREFERL
jgi:hypothetical protein